MLRYPLIMRIGVHVSIQGGVLQALERAKHLHCNTMQIFSRSPRGGPAPRLDPEALEAFDRQRRAADIDPLIVHAPYIMNLASPDAAVFSRSTALCQDEYLRCQALGARFLVAHVGSLRGSEEAHGIARVAEAVNRVLEAGAKSAGQPREPVMLLLENTAGSGQGLGDRFEQLAAMRERIEDTARVGICLDTAHLFAAGFAIHQEDGLRDTLDACDRILGLAHVRVVHLNDSKSAFDSRVDRHWHIGQGQIGAEGMGRIVREPRLAGLPRILETPKDSDEDDPRNLAMVRQLAAARPRDTAGMARGGP
jgi:deoxyribonuclease-4